MIKMRLLAILIAFAFYNGKRVAADLSHVKNSIGNINDISVHFQLLESAQLVQLQIHWRDNLPDATTYNILIVQTDPMLCTYPPCSIYGIQKPKDYLLLPDNTSPYMISDCGCILGCNYSLTIETSNVSVQRTCHVHIPLDLPHNCSHIKLLALRTSVEMKNSSSSSITLNWHLSVNASNEMLTEIYETCTLHFDIAKHHKPNLSWGGNSTSVAAGSYNFADLDYEQSLTGLKGTIEIFLHKAMPAGTLLSALVYISDAANCTSRPAQTYFKVHVDDMSFPRYKHFVRRSALQLTTAFIFGMLMITLMIFIRQRKQRERHMRAWRKTQAKQSVSALTPPLLLPMKDNIIYMDKCDTVTQAQCLDPFDSYEIAHNAIEFGPIIGEGAFGRVHKATALNLKCNSETTDVVAVKQLKDYPDAEEVREFLSEIQMLKCVGKHENVVRFLGCCTAHQPYLIVMEYVGRGSLLSYLRILRKAALNAVQATQATQDTRVNAAVKLAQSGECAEIIEIAKSIERKAKEEVGVAVAVADNAKIAAQDAGLVVFEYSLDSRELHNFALQIANGMRFLESRNITHRDLAARNVLIDDCKVLKVSDFGLSRYGIYTNTKSRKLPLRWLSIEAIHDNIYSAKSDVWAYGVVLWEIGTLGATPYPTVSNNELIPYLLAGKRLERPQIVSNEMYEIMRKCWIAEPAQRPDFKTLYKILSPQVTYVNLEHLRNANYVFAPIKETELNANDDDDYSYLIATAT